MEIRGTFICLQVTEGRRSEEVKSGDTGIEVEVCTNTVDSDDLNIRYLLESGGVQARHVVFERLRLIEQRNATGYTPPR